MADHRDMYEKFERVSTVHKITEWTVPFHKSMHFFWHAVISLAVFTVCAVKRLKSQNHFGILEDHPRDTYQSTHLIRTDLTEASAKTVKVHALGIT